jgi:glycosyltransferase involved in cell wall biosynthesis
MSVPKHIVLLTPGQPSSNPRLTKEAIALAAEGYRVTVLYSFWVMWAIEQDRLIIASNPSVQWVEIGGNPANRKMRYFFSRAIHKCYRSLSALFPSFLPFAVRAEIRTYSAMLYAAVAAKADLYIGHNLGGLAVAGRAADLKKTLYAFDAEDFHRGQTDPATAIYERTKFIEDRYVSGAAYVTAASPLIAKAYNELYHIEPLVINNVFSKKHLATAINEVKNSLELFWFSQTIGKERGLEDIILAMKQLPANACRFTLLGYCTNEMKRYLQVLGKRTDGLGVSLQFLDPVHPNQVFEIARQFDIGFAVEPGRDKNNQIALSNKLFTYLMCGNAVIFSSTPAQQLFYDTNPGIGAIYPCSDHVELAAVLKKYFDEPALLTSQKAMSLQLAREKYNWETESEHLLRLIKDILGNV